jgi:hypothetical protein
MIAAIELQGPNKGGWPSAPWMGKAIVTDE